MARAVRKPSSTARSRSSISYARRTRKKRTTARSRTWLANPSVEAAESNERRADVFHDLADVRRDSTLNEARGFPRGKLSTTTSGQQETTRAWRRTPSMKGAGGAVALAPRDLLLASQIGTRCGPGADVHRNDKWDEVDQPPPIGARGHLRRHVMDSMRGQGPSNFKRLPAHCGTTASNVMDYMFRYASASMTSTTLELCDEVRGLQRRSRPWTEARKAPGVSGGDGCRAFRDGDRATRRSERRRLVTQGRVARAQADTARPSPSRLRRPEPTPASDVVDTRRVVVGSSSQRSRTKRRRRRTTTV